MPRAEPSPDLRNPQLADALQIGDMAAVAFALRHGPTVVPLVETDTDTRIWTYRDAATSEVTLLLFSDAAHRPAELPERLALQPPESLRAFLVAEGGTISRVFLDVAGPHPLQATPADLLAALQA